MNSRIARLRANGVISKPAVLHLTQFGEVLNYEIMPGTIVRYRTNTFAIRMNSDRRWFEDINHHGIRHPRLTAWDWSAVRGKQIHIGSGLFMYRLSAKHGTGTIIDLWDQPR